MSKVSKRPSIVMPTTKENKTIVAAAKADPDAKPQNGPKNTPHQHLYRRLRNQTGISQEIRARGT
ncbi:MAG: hypothetical protein M9884_07085 [Rhodocyclaceae bacterium]|nr:hypothetical protein [Rhodocyclaceae bacterium]